MVGKQLKGVADGIMTGFIAGDGKTPSASASVQWDLPTAPTQLTEVLCSAIAGGANPTGPLGGYAGKGLSVNWGFFFPIIQFLFSLATPPQILFG